MFGSPFYHSSIRNLVIAFGSLFNDVRIIRSNPDGSTKEQIRLPISYGPKEKFLVRANQVSSLSDEIKSKVTLPRLGFDISSILYDNSRKRNTLQKRFLEDSSNNYKVRRTFSEVPYNFEFNLYIMVRNMDDGLQALEQIVPYFTPEFNVTLNLTDIATKVDVPIVLTSVNTEEEYEGDFDARRSITFTLSFTAKSYVYGPIKDQGIIRSVQATFFNLDPDYGIYGATGGTGAFSRVDVSATGPDAGPTGAAIGIGGYTTDFAHDLYVFGYTAGMTGGPGIDIRGNTV
tara:strand:+ start:1641 stop:2504 length:864 start_codon:yes stop_codon:yes gene_type:complete